MLLESVANSVGELGGLNRQMLGPDAIKMSRGVNGAGVALAETNGAIVMYFSPQPDPGICVNFFTTPKQSIVSMFWLQYSVASTSLLVAATPIGPPLLTMAKGCGLAAG